MTDDKKPAPKSDVDKLIEQAKAREAQILRTRKESPVDVVAGAPTFRDQRKEAIRVYAPECIPERDPGDPRKIIKPATRSAFWGPKAKALRYVNEGYVPVKDEQGEYVQDADDILFTRAKEIADAELKRAQEMSDARVKGPMAAAAEAGVKEEKIDVETTS